MRPVLANLGFVLQVAGILIVLPIIVAFYFNESESLISFFITSFVFLTSGFTLNALCERKELDFKSSCALIAAVFFLLGLIGSIPYFYTNIFPNDDVVIKFIDSYFESVSGYTTTGLTFVANPDSLAKSLVFYRSLTQWVGGIGIVYIILAFFHSGNVLDGVSRAIGFERVASTIKRSMIGVVLIYAFYVLVFVAILYFLGVSDLISNISMVFSTISTGGFSPVSNFSSLMPLPNFFVVDVLMILGATSFIVHFRWLTGKFKTSITSEFLTLLIIITVFTLLISQILKINLPTAFFHAASASTTTGYSFISFKDLSEGEKIIFVVLMFVGGSAFSTGGGIKILRLLLFFKSIPWVLKRMITGTDHKSTLNGKEFTDTEILSHLVVILLYGLMIFTSALIFSMHGFPFIDSIFEVTSASATVGLSVGITSISLPLTLKIILTLVMVFGRIEVLPFLVAVIPRKYVWSHIPDQP